MNYSRNHLGKSFLQLCDYSNREDSLERHFVGELLLTSYAFLLVQHSPSCSAGNTESLGKSDPQHSLGFTVPTALDKHVLGTAGLDQS